MPVPTSQVITWLLGLGWDDDQETGAPILAGPYVPEEPDQVVIITPAAGPGYALEGAADVSGFQARVRGPQSGDGSTGAQSAAEALAFALDSLIFAAPYPVVLPSGQVLMHAWRLSGVPSPLGLPDDAGRTTFTCSYLIQTSN